MHLPAVVGRGGVGVNIWNELALVAQYVGAFAVLAVLVFGIDRQIRERKRDERDDS